MRQTLPAEKRIELVHVNLMRSKQFAAFAGLFMVGKTTVSDVVKTAMTNGRDAHYGRSFVDSLTDRELAFLVMHENMHKCYRHLTTWKKLHDENHALANMACDYVINVTLVDLDPDEALISMPRDPATGKLAGLYDTRFRGMSAKQVFDILKEEQEDQQKTDPSDGEGGGDDAQGDGSDSPQDNSAGLDEHDWAGAKQMDAKEQEVLQREIDQALRQGAIYAGKVGANSSRMLGELLQPKVDWREVLRQFIKVHLRDRDSPSWRKAHKRYLWQDIILPSIIGKRIKRLGVCIDTSGSVEGALLMAFLTELNSVIKSVNPDRVDVLYWDTQVNGHETYKGSDAKQVFARTKPVGGGGTSPDCLPPYMRDKKLEFDAIVVLTDGYMVSDQYRWSEVTAPVLWCLIGNKDFRIPCGKVVHITED